MKRIFFTNVFIVFFLNCYSQNLVKNYSFESYHFLSCGITEQFNDAMIDWDSPVGTKGDIYSTTLPQDCYNHQPNTTYSGVIGIKGSASPSEGTVFVGIWVYTVNGLQQREYIRGKLTNALQVGSTYRVKMKISLADYMESYVGELGVAFMETQTVQSSGNLILATPQLVINEGLDVDNGWYEFETTFVSGGNYKYFIIGNFKSDANTVTYPNPDASEAVSTYGAYYYIDEVSVELVSVNSVIENEQSQIQVFPSLVEGSIQYNIQESAINNFKIVNQFGQIVRDEMINDNKEGFIDCSLLVPGMYYLVGANSNGLPISSTKFIKVK